jgi:hypothetical protein
MSVFAARSTISSANENGGDRDFANRQGKRQIPYTVISLSVSAAFRIGYTLPLADVGHLSGNSYPRLESIYGFQVGELLSLVSDSMGYRASCYRTRDYLTSVAQ